MHMCAGKNSKGMNTVNTCRLLGSTLNVVSLKGYGLEFPVPDVPVDRKALALEGMDYQVGISIGCWL
jgi:hypothetical protein